VSLEERERPQRAGWRAWEATPSARAQRIANASRTEASEIRYEAQEEARARRREAEADAVRCVEEARRSSEELVLGRLRRLSELNEHIQERYRLILQGLEGVQAAGTEVQLLVEALRRAADLPADAPVDRVQ
jgi:hypothetical protein